MLFLRNISSQNGFKNAQDLTPRWFSHFFSAHKCRQDLHSITIVDSHALRAKLGKVSLLKVGRLIVPLK